MIVMGLMGGLGNQLYQYGVGRHLSLRLGTELKLETSYFSQEWEEHRTPWSYVLDRFNIKASVIEADDLPVFLRGGNSRLRNLVNDTSVKLIDRRPLGSKRAFRERTRTFDPSVLDLPDNTFLQGYFASELYFRDVRNTILNELTVREPMDANNEDVARHIREENAVCIHVRRGDYYTDPAARKRHAVNLDEYYRNSIKLMREKAGKCHFFIFSDEPEWVRTNFSLDDQCTIVDVNTPEEPEKDLRLMSECRHFITANSSFSWWGAWLSRNEGKVVMTPRTWYLDDIDTRDLCPKEWLRV